ncbi:hypothetical protein M758_1G274700 [Ceratodon purpureus]|uniref:Uncharacterized protein n=1 Tax=Ceratodon purpureus TaxID=3225 RepID=A0A8T0JBG4_CERPU|nr:hypothetical protein KC19_1G283200 [Ceratodon purpureus]KAG0631718.1 hypothetical protein M758_1G274700 [Ceratodon purpureus]
MVLVFAVWACPERSARSRRGLGAIISRNAIAPGSIVFSGAGVRIAGAVVSWIRFTSTFLCKQSADQPIDRSALREPWQRNWTRSALSRQTMHHDLNITSVPLNLQSTDYLWPGFDHMVSIPSLAY